MTKNPIINGLGASAYIVLVASVMNFGSKIMPHNSSSTFLAPIAMISLFTLSAAVMGYIFLYQPAQLYFDGKKKQAVKLFLQTVAVFGFLTVVALTLLFTGVFSF
jgi:hypothetical protein